MDISVNDYFSDPIAFLVSNELEYGGDLGWRGRKDKLIGGGIKGGYAFVHAESNKGVSA